MIQRKDMEAIAALVAGWRMSLYSGTCDVLAADLADLLAASNPAFDRARFLAASKAMPPEPPRRVTMGAPVKGGTFT